MVKSTPIRDHSIVIKPRRRTRAGIAGLLAIVLIICLMLGIGFFAPARLALAQEQALGLLHGGIAERAERTYVDACVQLQGDGGPYAVTRTIRTITFRDGTSLSVTFSSSPTPSITPCSG